MIIHNSSMQLLQPWESPLARRETTREQALRDLLKLDILFDRAYREAVGKCLLEKLNAHYFRTQLVGFERLPQRAKSGAPLIFVSNHAGMAFPWDAMAFLTDFQLHHDELRALVAPNFADSLQPFLIRDFWLRSGGVVANYANFLALMQQREADILVYPEGVPGICKGFNNRYQIQRLATSVVRMSIEFQTPIVPFATVNSEYINPFTYTVQWVNAVGRKLGIPYLPLGPSLILPVIQPWCFYFALPAKLTYVLGKPFNAYELVGRKFLKDVPEREIRAVTQLLSQQMQKELDQAVLEHGDDPYAWRSFWREQWQSGFKYFPLLWTPLFRTFDRRFRQARKTLNDADLVAKMLSYAPHSPWDIIANLLCDFKGLLLYVPVIGMLVLIVGRLRNLKGPERRW